MQNKDLEYYLSLDYDITLRKTVDGDNIHFKATTRELNPDVFYGIGDSVEEAVAELRGVCEEVFPYYFEEGIAIPEPQPYTEDLPSGNFPVRATPATHKKLSDLAKENRISLNAMVNKILTEYITGETLTDRVASEIGRIVSNAVEPSSMAWVSTSNYRVEETSAEVTDKVVDLSQWTTSVDKLHVAGT